MMNYMDLVEMAKRGRPLNRIKLVTGQTNGCIKLSPTRENKHTKLNRAPLGTDYAKTFRMEDEMEDYRLGAKVKTEDNKDGPCSDMNDVECLSSVISCIPDPLDLVKDELITVYDNYCFVHPGESSLLISDYKEEILRQIDVSPVTIIRGQTGCGKTTQVPQYILDNCVSRNVHCNIVVTQPRRIAAISIANRVCSERNWPIGSIVGYQISLEKCASSDTRLLYCTTGILMHQLIHKQTLSQYTHIVIDEVHERDQETDFLLIVVKQFLKTPGCRTKVILMSATMNTDRFSNYFSKTVNGVKIEPPVIELETLTKYPVYYYYLDSLVDKIPVAIPEVSLSQAQILPNMYDVACLLVEAFQKIDSHEHKVEDFIGSVLIFLPGIHEIDVMYERLSLRKNNPSKETEKWWLCPLHSSITFDEQMRVFKPAPKGHRKIILATNIAESSITVPDVKYVIDFCLVKLLIQEPDTNFTSLQLSWVSKSQADQRAGRVGRVMPGRVYRLIPEGMFNDLEEDCIPEMVRSPLDQVILQVKSLNIGSPISILGRALDPPDLSNIQRTILNLKEMGALLLTSNGKYVEDDGDLTFIGSVMAALPLDTHLSKLIILGHMFSLLTEAVIMASAMSVKSMFSTPFRQQLDAYNSKLSWADCSCSDPIAFLNAYRVWRFHKSSGRFKRSGGTSESDWAKRYFIQLNSMNEVARLEAEILNRLKGVGIVESTSDSRVIWEENVEKPLILKLVIAGAFYPNYFLRRQVDEAEAVKILGGKDPFSTVYLLGMPTNQPGLLYANVIRNKFLHCGSQISVSFDGSSKVYLQFGSSNVLKDEGEKETVAMPGKIMMAVYRAIKLRHLQIPVTIPVLLPREAEIRARSFLGDYQVQTFCWSKKKEQLPKQSVLPGLNETHLKVNVSYIESPSKFWVQSCVHVQRLNWVHVGLNTRELPKLRQPLKLGTLCVAPYKDIKAFNYRARIKSLGTPKSTLVLVFFVDYGNSEWVDANDLMDFTDDMVESGLRDEPEMAVECMLSEIQPSLFKNPKGSWSKDLIETFKKMFLGSTTYVQVYSVVGTTMSVNLFIPKEDCRDCELESYNDYLISRGFAEPADEPLLSRENHILREMAANSPEMLHNFGKGIEIMPNETIDIESPSEKECRTRVHLKGPKSPLEMSLYSISQKSQGMEITVDWNSVNSVLLDTYPMDPHDRMLVACAVTQNFSGDRLTLRNTTMLPNIHGLPSLLTMIFAPRVQLRTDKNKTQLTGAICGLGYDPCTKIPYNSDNDIELTFDTKFDLSDLEDINRLRYWMNSIVFGGKNWDEEMSRPKIIDAQRKIRRFILGLLSKKRMSSRCELNPRPFEWGLIEEEELLHPMGGSSSDDADEPATIYPLIWGVHLNQVHPSVDAALISHINHLIACAEGKEVLRSGVMCKLCQVYLDSVPNLRLHLQTSIHKESCKQLNLNSGLFTDFGQVQSSSSRYH